MRVARAICIAVALAAGPAGAQTASPQAGTAVTPSPEALRLHTALETCFSCHGPGGVSVIPSRPTIAGQKTTYIARQLNAFKRAVNMPPESDSDADNVQPAGQSVLPLRSDPVMEHMAQNLDNALISQLAGWISNLPCDGNKGGQARLNEPRKPAVTARCDVCHGANGIGTQPHIPNLAGQHEAYLRRQLLLIRETAYGAEPRVGERWRSHPIMERQAARLSIADVDALASYYSALDCHAGTAAPAQR